VTDTIAWNMLPRPLFQKLFRQDLLVASLFRNFLLAERILHAVNVTPCSLPRLPPTYNHPLWQAWDLAVDLCLAQLDTLQHDPPVFKASSFFQVSLTSCADSTTWCHKTTSQLCHCRQQ
jgi:regulator-associated protein of mTOR